MKKITREIVGQFVRALVTLNGQTTTLEVKNALRNQDYFATQDQVRNFMLDITSNDGDIEYADGQYGYRIYRFKDTDDIVDDVFSDATGTADLGFDIAKFCTTSTTPIAYGVKVDSDNIPAKYCVCDKNGRNEKTFVDVTRGQAKWQWSRDTGIPYAFARTTKLF